MIAAHFLIKIYNIILFNIFMNYKCPFQLSCKIVLIRCIKEILFICDSRDNLSFFHVL